MNISLLFALALVPILWLIVSLEILKWPGYKACPIAFGITGLLGTFVTGSDTSANVLFGNLQAEAARAAGANPYWIAAVNTGGATAGKMISPQSIAIAVVATGLAGSEGKILGTTIKFCAVYVIILGLVSYFCSSIFGF